MFRLVFALLMLLLSACAAPVTRLPAPESTRQPDFLPAPGETPPPALLERRELELNWPARIREKDSDRIELIIRVAPQSLATATVVGEGPNQGEKFPVDIPNIYDTHNLVAIARLDIAGMEAIREEMRESLQPGREVVFRWSVRANEPGVYRGVVWLHLEMVPKNGGAAERVLLLARPVDIAAYTILGMSGSLARTLGVLGLVASTVLGFPLIQRVLDALFKRKQNPPPPPENPAKPVA